MTTSEHPRTTPAGRLAAAAEHYRALAAQAAGEHEHGPRAPELLHAWEWRQWYADLREPGAPPADA